MKIKYRLSKDKRCKKINEMIQKDFPHMITEKKPDILLVSGGDGALLHAIQEHNHYKIPFFGYGTGTLNFMMNEMPIDKFEIFLNKLENDQVRINIIETTKIEVNLLQNKTKKNIQIGKAVNEVVIGSKLMGYHSFSIDSGDGSFNNFQVKGTGICLSTELGSTGYNFNLGGAVLPLGSNLWSILGIVCNRYLEDILNTNKITIKSLSKKNTPYIFLDGIKQNHKINFEDSIVMKRGDTVRLAFYDKKEFFEKRIDISSRYRKC